MKKLKRILLIIVILALMVIMLTACGGESDSASTDSETIVIKATQPFNQTHPWGQGFEYLGKILEERSNGELIVETYHSSSISGGSTRTMIEMVGTGGATMMINSPLVYQGWNKNYQVFSLPFLFPDKETGFAAMKSELGTEALSWMEPNGMLGVGVVENGYRHLTTNTGKPITSPEDMKGLKLRIPDSPLLISTFTAMGSSPMSLNMTEVYTSIQQGTVDGQENPIAVIDSNKIYEVAPYITVWTYNWDPAFMMCNKTFLDGLTEEQRTLFQECVDETCDYINKMINDNEATQLKRFEDAGSTVTVLTVEQTQAFKDVTAKVYDECRAEIGSEIVDGFVNTVEELTKK